MGENVEKVVKEIGKSVLAFLEIKNIEGRHRHEKMSRGVGNIMDDSIQNQTHFKQTYSSSLPSV